MTRYIAFIRGINGGLTLKMVDLRQLFERLEFRNIQTVLATGNVVFESSERREDIIRRIEQGLYETYNYKTTVILYTEQDLRQLVKIRPFKYRLNTTEASQQVSFVASRATLPFALPYHKPEKGYSILSKMGNAIFSTLDLSGKTRPDMLLVLDKIFESKVTTRNWQTILRVYRVILTQ